MRQTLIVLVLVFVGVTPIEELYYWELIDYQFPDTQIRNEWLNTGKFQPNNTILLDSDFTGSDPKQRIFATTPPLRTGSPATLSTVFTNSQGRVWLQPYPSWDENTKNDCSGLTSVLRVKATDCGHLWVLDSGRVDAFGKNYWKCQPKLRVYDLTTDEQIWEYVIPDKDLSSNSLLGNVELYGNCRNPIAYLADIVGYGIVVVDTAKSVSWRVQNDFTKNERDASQFNVDGEQFVLNDGVISLVTANGILYLHSLASYHENLVPTWVLNDPRNLVNGNEVQYFKQSSGQRSGQSGPAAVARNGAVMFFSNIPENSLYCWRPGSPYESNYLNLVFRDDVKFQFASGLKVIKKKDGQEWILATTTRFQNFINNKVNPREINYRIITVKVDDSILSRC